MHLLASSLNLLTLAQQNDGAAAAGGIVMLLFTCCFGIVGLAAFGFWLWMLIDCLTKQFPGSEKVVWVLVIVFLNFIGAVVYYFIGRPKGTKG